MGGGVNSLQFYGRFGAGKRRCGVVEDSAMETATSLRGPGNSRRLLWLHDRVRSSFAWRVAAAALANALELPTDAAGAALCRIIRDSSGSDNGDGSDIAGANRGPGFAAE